MCHRNTEWRESTDPVRSDTPDPSLLVRVDSLEALSVDIQTLDARIREIRRGCSRPDAGKFGADVAEAANKLPVKAKKTPCSGKEMPLFARERSLFVALRNSLFRRVFPRESPGLLKPGLR